MYFIHEQNLNISLYFLCQKKNLLCVEFHFSSVQECLNIYLSLQILHYKQSRLSSKYIYTFITQPKTKFGMPSTTSSSYVPLATEQPNGYDGNGGLSGTDIGASGNSSSAITLSTGGMVAIIVVVVVVSIIGGK